MYSFEPATHEHVEELVDNIRAEDAQEIDALTGKQIKFSLQDSIDSSDEAWTCFIGGRVACIFGIGRFSLLSSKASPWLITTNLLSDHKKSFMKATKIALEYWGDRYDVLENYVDARYKQALRWAGWAGFTVHDAEPYGPYGNMFHRIEIRNN